MMRLNKTVAKALYYQYSPNSDPKTFDDLWKTDTNFRRSWSAIANAAIKAIAEWMAKQFDISR